MRIVMTGGLGFIGQNLAAYLRETGDYSLAAVDWFAGASKEETDLFDDVAQCCLSDPQAFDLYTGADVVVHLAARTTVQESIDDPLATFRENVVKTQSLLEHLRKNSPDTKVVFASTGGAIIGDYDGAVNEEIAAKPLSPYGASKLAVEGLLSGYRGSFGLSSAAMRFSNVYGPRSYRKGSVVAAFCKSYLETGTLQVNGDGKQTRDYIYCDDISDAIARVIDQDGQGVFQLGTGRGTSINEIVDIFQGIDPTQDIQAVTAPALKGEVRHNKADITRARTELGFNPVHSVEDGVRQTLRWFQNRPYNRRGQIA